jgi:hypothetical protein
MVKYINKLLFNSNKMKYDSPLENKILNSLDIAARVMMPISGDALVLREARKSINNGENKFKIISICAGGIALKYLAIGYAVGLYDGIIDRFF